MTIISNCGKDERGKYSGGKAGDQGGEWVLKNWYNRPWNVVLRHPDSKVRDMVAEMARAAANNDKVGYDQGQRLTFWTQLSKVGYKPENIKTACEADCSSGVAAIVKGAGYRLKNTRLQAVPTTCWTGNLRKQLVAAGFTALTDKKYTSTSDWLLPGDILLNEQHHVATNVTRGIKVTIPVPVPDKVKSVEDIAKEVIAGKWGTGSDRVKRLKAAGYDYDAVQKRVNVLLRQRKSVEEIAKEIIAGKWGVGTNRKKRLEAAGYDYDEIQRYVNNLMR